MSIVHSSYLDHRRIRLIWKFALAFSACRRVSKLTVKLRHNSGMAQPIVTKFGVCLETKQRCILHRSWVRYMPHFGIPETAGRIELKFVVWLGDH